LFTVIRDQDRTRVIEFNIKYVDIFQHAIMHERSLLQAMFGE